MEKQKGSLEVGKRDEKLDAFLDNELDRMEAERQETLTGKGYADFLKLETGETKITLIPLVPRLVQGGFGDRMAFRVAVGLKEFDWAINPRSPMYHQLLVLLRKAPVDVKVVRVGVGKNTRYDIKS